MKGLVSKRLFERKHRLKIPRLELDSISQDMKIILDEKRREIREIVDMDRPGPPISGYFTENKAGLIM